MTERVRPTRSLDLGTTVLVAVGFACMISYSRMLSQGFVGYLTEGGAAIADPYYLMRIVAEVATLVVLAVGGLTRRLSVTSVVCFLCTVVMTAATIVVAATPHLGQLGYGVFFVAGAANAVVMYVWMLLLSRFAAGTILTSTLAGLGVAGVVVMGAPRLGSETCLVIAVICAFVAGSIALRLDPQLESARADGSPRAVLSRIPWFSVVLILVSGILGILLYTIALRRLALVTDGPNMPVFALAAVLTLTASVLVMLRRRDWVHVVWVPSFVLLALAIIVSSFVSDATVQATLGLLMATVFCSRFLCWLVFPAMFSLLRVPRAFLAGALLILVNGSLITYASSAIGALLPANIQVISNVGGVVAAVLALVLAAAMAINREANLRPYEFEAEDEAGAARGTSELFPSAFSQMAPAFRRSATDEREGAAPSDGGVREADAASSDRGGVVPLASQAEGPIGDDGASGVARGTEEPAPIDGSGARGADEAGDGEAGRTDHADDADGEGGFDAVDARRPSAAASGDDLLSQARSRRSEERRAASVATASAAGLASAPADEERSIADQLKARVDVASAQCGLTARESEVTLLTVQGFSCAYISGKLVVSNSTVRYHQQNAYRKLGVHSRNELIEFVNGISLGEHPHA
ncbi:hypothetical protein HLV37_04020 [Eggerthellaceae bacterium zg-1084]|uniref:LuxR C-terminal-related transcriptional regulator n=1 Tax=Berryella wangjianweii TaxID=2734634 RepID=UPI001554FCF7|nr:LuxR C-terminal-related transcriptional regulator [Berryella wangjianweii]NPD31031.1 hypothetical protein [Berryella wangjianweii]